MESIYAKMQVWTDKSVYEQAEKHYYEMLTKENKLPEQKPSISSEIAKARERIIESLSNVDKAKCNFANELSRNDGTQELLNQMDEFRKRLTQIEDLVSRLAEQLKVSIQTKQEPVTTACKKLSKPSRPSAPPAAKDDDDDDDVDLFGSDSEEDEAAEKLKQQRVAEYTARKSNKPVLVAKSNIILDVKPWDDETDMKVMETEVRKIEMDGLVWGASKLVPLAYGIKKLQISCVVEDDKVSIDDLQEKLEALEDYVQSVDIAAFNKV